MYQYDDPTVVASLPAPAAPGTAGFFTDGDPAKGEPATLLRSDFVNTLMLEMLNTVEGAGITPSKTDNTQLFAAIRTLASAAAANYSVDTGTANTYTVAYTPAVSAITDGLKLRFRAKTANTGASTFSPNGLTAHAIVGGAHAALQGGEIIANGDIEVIWNSVLAAWVLLEQTGGGAQVGAATNSSQAMQLGQATGRLLNLQQFPNAGTFTYTPTAGTKWVEVEVQGGGAAGSGSLACTSSQNSVGQQGGAGAYGKTRITSGFSGASIVVGAAGVAASGATGTGGGTSSFGAFLSAPGGTAGNAPAVMTGAGFNGNTTPSSPSVGGNIVNSAGGVGVPATILVISAFAGNLMGSMGGSSQFGTGGYALTVPGSGNPGIGHGAGGGGGVTVTSGAAQSGGAGTPGMVIVWEYA